MIISWMFSKIEQKAPSCHQPKNVECCYICKFEETVNSVQFCTGINNLSKCQAIVDDKKCFGF